MRKQVRTGVAAKTAVLTKPSKADLGDPNADLNMTYVKRRCNDLGFSPTDAMIELAKDRHFLDSDPKLHVDIVKTLLEYSEEKPKTRSEANLNTNVTLADILIQVSNERQDVRSIDNRHDFFLEGESSEVCE